ncbi:MAG: acetylxylan esterase [Lentisphaerae bacterium]|nr:acetylxylan esterase [Lentisphaerota bacterium]
MIFQRFCGIKCNFSTEIQMKKFLSFLTAALVAIQLFADYDLKVTSTAGDDGIVKCGEKVTLTAQAFKDGKALDDSLILHTVIRQDGQPVRSVKTPADQAFSIEITMNEPGRAYIRCWLKDPKNPKTVLQFNNPRNRKFKLKSSGIGFFADPDKQRIMRQEPEDFDKFWDAKKAELAKVPLVVKEKVAVKTAPQYAKDFEVYDMKLACVGPVPVSGIITIPKDKTRKYPAMVQYHGAGVRSAAANFRPGFITFNVNAHGLINRQPKKFYDDITEDKTRNPYFQSAEKRYEMFCFMFLRALRALEYVRTLSEWNGKDLVVTGGSQGGVQTLAAAALDENVTLAVPTIPAMVGSAEFMLRKNVESAWPNSYSKEFYQKQDVTAIARKYDYIDGAFFMRRITCQIHVAVGLFDTHAAHVFAAFNSCPAKVKTITGVPDMGHYNYNPQGIKAIGKLAKTGK